MSKHVRISVVAPRPLVVEYTSNLQNVVDEMKKNWKKQLDQVLCDRPDLIVLPEACDRPPNFSMEQRFAYYHARGDQILEFFQDIAKNNNCFIAYSAAREVEDGTWRNSTRLIDDSTAQT